MKLFWNVCAIILTQAASAQYFFVPSDAHVEIASEATLHVSADAIFTGSLSNEGIIELEQHADFGENAEVGVVRLLGASAQAITGNELIASKLEVDREGVSTLATSAFLVKEELKLTSGILDAGWAGITVSGEVAGGGDESFVDGKLTIIKSEKGSVTYPVGYNSTYLPITLAGFGDAALQVEAKAPQVEALRPNQDLVGISDLVIWEVTHTGNVALNSQVTLGYPDLDPAEVKQTNPIRSRAYAPVVSILQDSVFIPLGDEAEQPNPQEVMSNTRSGIVSTNALRLDNASAILGIGVAPVLSGTEFYIPNVFVPSGEYQENKQFRPFLSDAEAAEISITIWDQRNNKVFEENVIDVPLEATGWDGTIRGAEAAQGVYYYSIRVITREQRVFEQSGTTMLVR